MRAKNEQAMKERDNNSRSDRVSGETKRLEEKKQKYEEAREEVRRAWDQAFFRSLDQLLIRHEMAAGEGKVQWESAATSRVGTSNLSRRGSAVPVVKRLVRSLDMDEGECESEGSDSDSGSINTNGVLKAAGIASNGVYNDERVLKLAELGLYKSLLKLSRPAKIGGSRSRGILRGVLKGPSNSAINTRRDTESVRMMPENKGDGVSIFSFERGQTSTRMILSTAED